MNKQNPPLHVDFYKTTHHIQLPIGTENLFEYIESRGGKYPKTVFFGLQAYLKEYLVGQFVTREMIDEAEEICGASFGFPYFNKAGWQYILEKHNGRLPIRIKALKEGTIIPTKNALVSVEILDSKCSWLVGYIETSLLRAVWYPTTTATNSYYLKQMIKKYCDETGCNLSPFHMLDFGARGVSSHESASLGGMAHLSVGWLGTDTIEGILAAKQFYNAKGPVGFSVNATEHMTTTIYGKENELEAYTNFLDRTPENAILSIVIDSYDDENCVKNLLGGKLKERILARSAHTVFRPDSGDPTTKPLQVVQWLWDIFGGTINEKGFKVLNPKVLVLQGDGIAYNTAEIALQNLKNAGFAASNVIFGSGSSTLQDHRRDDLKFAMKCSAAKVNGEWRDVFKQPKTDSGKASKMGRLAVVLKDGEFKTVREEECADKDNLLELVFENGELKRDQTFEEIRAIVANS